MQDVVVIFVSVTGTQKGELYEENYLKKIYPQVISERLWSAIQVTTAGAVSGIIDIVLQNESQYHGFVTQESFALSTFLANRFGSYYK
jgi:saccharopine dehydrogenase-like NADP-dependent oxidoreductase